MPQPLVKPDNVITLGILAAALIAATWAVYLPQSRELDEVRSEIASKRTALEIDASKLTFLPELEAQIATLKEQHQDFDCRMPKDKELAGFLREINGALASEELSNLQTLPGDPTREELYHTLPITMDFEGGYLSLASLLKSIDEMERFTRVQNLVIKRDPRSKDLKIEVLMNIYFQQT